MNFFVNAIDFFYPKIYTSIRFWNSTFYFVCNGNRLGRGCGFLGSFEATTSLDGNSRHDWKEGDRETTRTNWRDDYLCQSINRVMFYLLMPSSSVCCHRNRSSVVLTAAPSLCFTDGSMWKRRAVLKSQVTLVWTFRRHRWLASSTSCQKFDE